MGRDEKGCQSGHGMGGGLFGDPENANLEHLVNVSVFIGGVINLKVCSNIFH